MNLEARLDAILDAARSRASAAEVYGIERSGKILFIANGGHPDLQTYDLAEVALRVVKDGRLGSGYGSLMTEPSKLVDAALLSAAYGATCDWSFTAKDPADRKPRRAKIYDPACAELPAEWLADEGRRIRTYVLKREKDIQFNVQLDTEVRRVAYANTNGRRGTYDRTRLTTFLQHIFEGSKEGIEKLEVSCRPFEFPAGKLDELIWERRAMRKTAKAATGPAKVLFLPTATWALAMRLTHGVDGMSVAKDMSPLSQRLGEQIFAPAITVHDAPDRDWEPGSVPFDDEGTPTTPRAVVDGGHLKGFLYHHKSAALAKTTSTGNGFKRSMWGDGIEDHPAPYFANLVMEPGQTPIAELVRGLDDGYVVCDVIGFHSGNILAGHFSMGVGTGFRVKKGKPVGRVVDTLVSGNVYQDFKRVVALSEETEPTLVGRLPAVLFEGMQVSTKG